MPFVATETTPGISWRRGKLAEPGPPPQAGGLFAEGTIDMPGFLNQTGVLSFRFEIGIGTRVTITSVATVSTSIDDCPITDDCMARASVSFNPGQTPPTTGSSSPTNCHTAREDPARFPTRIPAP